MTIYSGHLWLHFHVDKYAREVSINMSNVDYVEQVNESAKVHFSSGKALVLSESLKDVMDCVSSEWSEQRAQRT